VYELDRATEKEGGVMKKLTYKLIAAVWIATYGAMLIDAPLNPFAWTRHQQMHFVIFGGLVTWLVLYFMYLKKHPK